MMKWLAGIVLALSVSAGPDCDEQLSKALTERAEVVVVAKVIEVEPPLGLWSGYHAIGQHVKYEVEEVIKGKLAEREIYVAHGIVKNTPTADTEQARLSPKLFVKGNRFVLFLTTEHSNGYLTRTHPAKTYLSLNEKCLPTADVETVKLIRQYAGDKQ
jgi:hypothetical protein